MHGRGEVFAAAVTLASGLKRSPEHEDALDWFLSLYLEELPNPGLERELLQVLSRQADGHARFGGLLAELEHLERFDKIEALQLAMTRHGIVLPQRAPATPAFEAPALQAPDPAADESVERWDRFESPMTGRNAAIEAPHPESSAPSDPGEAEAPAPDALDEGESEEGTRVRYVAAEEVAPSPTEQTVPQALLLGVALIIAAAAMVWLAFAQMPEAPVTAFEPAGSGAGPLEAGE